MLTPAAAAAAAAVAITTSGVAATATATATVIATIKKANKYRGITIQSRKQVEEMKDTVETLHSMKDNRREDAVNTTAGKKPPLPLLMLMLKC
mmetsp:Transcript_23251/g.26919  ORF Transcript_23251/g.26919 Transcript_23251/m.26919 type:complete len:93 (-) Transcript_23251:54-332(-)